jgi:hypothetical protein
MFARKKKKVRSIIKTAKRTRESDRLRTGTQYEDRFEFVPVEIRQRYAVDKNGFARVALGRSLTF